MEKMIDCVARSGTIRLLFSQTLTERISETIYLQNHGSTTAATERNRHIQGSSPGRILGTLVMPVSTDSVREDQWANM